MLKAAMEIDFLGLEEEGEAASTFGYATSSTPGVHSSLPKLSTQLGRTAITSARTDATTSAGPPENLHFFPPLSSPAEQRQLCLAPMPVRSPASRCSPGADAPLTIFYNGTVATFNLPRDKADAIIKWAERTTSRVERPTLTFGRGGQLQQRLRALVALDKLGGDLPLARKRSLQRFLEKRKER